MKGRCACGEIRFHFEGEVIESSWCHCRNCQRISGAPAAVYVTVRRDQFAFDTGKDTVGHVSLTDFAERLFCNKCGTPIATQLDHQPEWIDITAATLDDPDRYPPEFHIHHSSRIGWFETTDDLPRHAASRSE